MPRPKKRKLAHWFQPRSDEAPPSEPAKQEKIQSDAHLTTDPSPSTSTANEPSNQPPVVRNAPSFQKDECKPFKVASNVTCDSSDSDGENIKARLRSATKTFDHEIHGKYRLVHLNKQLNMFNETIIEHHNFSQKCVPQFELNDEKKCGFVVAHQLRCTKCTFVSSKTTELYECTQKQPSQPGRPAAVPNMALSAAILGTSIGPTKARVLLNALDIPQLSLSAMQHLSTKAADKIEKVNDQSMKKLLIEDSTNNTIDISADTVYNTYGYRVERRTGLNSTTQATTVAIEQNSGKSHVVAVHQQNKDCKGCSMLRAQDPTINPIGHPGCTANTDRFAPLSEYVGGVMCAQQISSVGVAIESVVTDGDSMCFKGFQDEAKIKDPDTNIHRLADPVHYHQAKLKSSVKYNTFSQESLNVTTKKDQNELSKTLFTDIKSRCSLALKNVYRKHKNDYEKVIRDLPEIRDTIAACYRGECKNCPSNSGGTCDGDRKSWWHRSRILGPRKITELNMNENDIELLNKTIIKIIGPEAVEKTKGLKNTQMNEALNKCINSICPKNLKFSRVIKGKLAHAILQWNLKPQKAYRLIAKALGIKPSLAQKKFYKHLNNKRLKDIVRQKKGQPKDRRRNIQAGYIRAQKWERQREGKKEKHRYRKNILDHSSSSDSETPLAAKLVQAEHSYPWTLRRK